MAAEKLPVDKPATLSPSKESFMNGVFMPEETVDVVLVVENGKQFKLHRKVLSEACPFFEKLLNSDMKESKEGEVRLEMFSESVMAATLEFIYTGNLYGYYTRAENSLSKRWQLAVSYNPYTNAWKQIPPQEEDRCALKIFAKSEGEMYALLCDRCPVSYCGYQFHCHRVHSMFMSKYKPKSHSWELDYNYLYPYAKEGVCIVANEHFMYFIGGLESGSTYFVANDVDRYDLSKGKWDKVANIQLARRDATGAAVNGKIFIAGGKKCHPQCEVYDETTDEWQFIASFKRPKVIFRSLLAAYGKVYAVCCEIPSLAAECDSRQISVECYNPEKDEWEMKTETALPVIGFGFTACVMRLFKGLPHIRPLETITPDGLSEATIMQASPTDIGGKRKCICIIS
ncbi:hypothetical protein ACROYT_G002276 [Oculina patagonica]